VAKTQILTWVKTATIRSTSTTVSYGRLAGLQADKIVLYSEILKLNTQQNIQVFLAFDKDKMFL